MQIYTIVSVLVLAGVAVSAASVRTPEQEEKMNVLTSEVNKLHLPSQKSMKLFFLMVDINADADVSKCNHRYFAAIESLINWFHTEANSPILAKYITADRDRQSEYCLAEKGFVVFNNYTFRTAMYLAGDINAMN